MSILRIKDRNFLLCAMFLCACGTTYKPTLIRFDPVGTNSRKAIVDNLTVYVEEYLSGGKSERAFDTNLAELNLLPLLVRIENNGSDSYHVDPATF